MAQGNTINKIDLLNYPCEISTNTEYNEVKNENLLYPNPGVSSFKIKIPEEQIKSIKILNSIGQAGAFNSLGVQIYINAPPSIYYILIELANKTITSGLRIKKVIFAQ